MKSIFGAIVVSGTGKLGGSAFSKGRHGVSMKRRVVPVDRESHSQSVVRTNMHAMSASWRVITEDQRNLWHSATINGISGFALYSKLNLSRLSIGQTLLSTPPASFSSLVFTTFSAYASYIDSSLWLYYTPVIPAGFVVKIFVTKPLSPGVSQSTHNKVLLKILTSADSSPINIGSVFVEKFGFIGHNNDKLFLSIVPCELDSGLNSSSLDLCIQVHGNIVYHYYVAEDQPRVASHATIYAGSVRMVGIGQTYSTITAAISASVSGDIIQLIDGTYDMNNEPNNYLLWDALTKNLLLRGNVTDSSKVIIKQSGSSNFLIRLYKTGDIRIESLTLQGSKNLANIYTDFNSASMYHKFKNCIFTNSNSGAQAGFYASPNYLLSALSSQIEFENCYFSKLNSASQLFAFTNCGINYQLLFINCQWLTSALTIPLSVQPPNLMKIALYNCYITQMSNQIALYLGFDGTPAASNLGKIDMRYNVISLSSGIEQHTVLLGRGCDECYIINNQFNVLKGDSSLNIGLVVKVISSDVSKSIIAGNMITAARSMLTKGGSNVTYRYNTFKSIRDSSYAAGFQSDNYYDGSSVIESKENIVSDNNIIGKNVALLTGSDALVPLAKESIQACFFDRNFYYSVNGDWANDGVVHQLSAKSTFWTSAPTNDDNSSMVENYQIIISDALKTL
jgi:hypothetical protein